jgi:hypothetical protein
VETNQALEEMIAAAPRLRKTRSPRPRPRRSPKSGPRQPTSRSPPPSRSSPPKVKDKVADDILAKSIDSGEGSAELSFSMIRKQF